MTIEGATRHSCQAAPWHPALACLILFPQLPVVEEQTVWSQAQHFSQRPPERNSCPGKQTEWLGSDQEVTRWDPTDWTHGKSAAVTFIAFFSYELFQRNRKPSWVWACFALNIIVTRCQQNPSAQSPEVNSEGAQQKGDPGAGVVWTLISVYVHRACFSLHLTFLLICSTLLAVCTSSYLTKIDKTTMRGDGWGESWGSQLFWYCLTLHLGNKVWKLKGRLSF